MENVDYLSLITDFQKDNIGKVFLEVEFNTHQWECFIDQARSEAGLKIDNPKKLLVNDVMCFVSN